MNRKDVEVIERATVFQGYFRVDRYRLRHRLFEGGWSEEMSREIFERGHAVCVILFDPAERAVVLIEQFRPGAFAAGASAPWFNHETSPWLIECVAGIIEPGEDEKQVALRETHEEAGCDIDDAFPVFRYFATPGGSSESVSIWCGKVDAKNVSGVHGLDHEHEDIRVLAVPVADAFQWVREGRICNAMTLIALQWLELNLADVTRRWSASG